MKKRLFLLSALVMFCFFIISSAFAADNFRFYSVKPSKGGPGSTVTLNGDGFGDRKGESKVFFGTTEARVLSWKSNEISVIVPDNAKTEDLVEVKSKKESQTFMPVYIELEGSGKSQPRNFDLMPHILHLSPDRGGAGDTVTITGFNFGDYVDLGKVFIGTTPVKIQSWSDSKIVCLLPASVKPEEVVSEQKKNKTNRGIDIFVQTGGIKGEGEKFAWDPTIISVEPKQAGPGSKIQLKGRNFGKIQESIRVKFASREPAPAVLADDTIITAIPTDITADELTNSNLMVTVISGGVPSNEKPVPIAPEIKTVHPSSTRGGAVIIKGAGFGSSAKDGRVVLTSKDSSKSDEFDAGVLSWTDDEIKIEFPTGKNTTTSELVYSITIWAGKLKSNSKELKIPGQKK
ncbi:MAG: IPT/TIG domain-containing protein [Firmicutes bacterium]|nr:IPT/TIG domain-containing protein [Bacillota bacterium]